MRSILNIGKDLVKELRRTGNPELLIELFKTRTSDWKYKQLCMEGKNNIVFSDLKNFHCSSLAYNLIPHAVLIALNQEDTNNLLTSLSLLYVFIKESKTTEKPKELFEKWGILENKVREIESENAKGIWNEIKRWYRMQT